MEAASDDSVPLDGGPAAAPRLRVANYKLLLALFLMFITVSSDVFTNSVVAGFGASAVRGREPTSWGVVIQGIFLVLGYVLMVYLTENEVI